MVSSAHEQVLFMLVKLFSGTGNLLWALTGSMSFALQGMPVEVHDIDIQCDEKGAYKIGELLAPYEVSSVNFSSNGKMSSHFGKFLIDGIEVEVMGDLKKQVGGTWEESLDLASIIKYVDYKGLRVPVLDLLYEVSAYEKMGRHERSRQIEDFLKK